MLHHSCVQNGGKILKRPFMFKNNKMFNHILTEQYYDLKLLLLQLYIHMHHGTSISTCFLSLFHILNYFNLAYICTILGIKLLLII